MPAWWRHRVTAIFWSRLRFARCRWSLSRISGIPPSAAQLLQSLSGGGWICLPVLVLLVKCPPACDVPSGVRLGISRVRSDSLGRLTQPGFSSVTLGTWRAWRVVLRLRQMCKEQNGFRLLGLALGQDGESTSPLSGSYPTRRLSLSPGTPGCGHRRARALPTATSVASSECDQAVCHPLFPRVMCSTSFMRS